MTMFLEILNSAPLLSHSVDEFDRVALHGLAAMFTQDGVAVLPDRLQRLQAPFA